MLLFSCVYFNTFYNAEVSFKKAIKIIEESALVESNELPSQAKKLLGESIDNSKLVIRKYPDSKYVDDAIFIIARSAFIRQESAVSERYFNKLLKEYPESNYFSESEIWLAYSHFRLGLIDSSQSTVARILKNNKINNKELYIIHNLLAEVAELNGNIEEVFLNYELAAKYASMDSEKTATFSKLVKISEINNDKNKSIEYLEELGKVAPNKIRIDSKMKWLVYNRELGNYDKIITEIELMLGLSEFSTEYIKLELELGKVYMEKGELLIAKDIFLQMVEVYSKKNETSEAYFQLAKISLSDDFNIDLAKEYLEKSKKEKSQSKYGKKSKDLLNKIQRFEDLESSYKDLSNKYEDLVNSQTDDFYSINISSSLDTIYNNNESSPDTVNNVSNNLIENPIISEADIQSQLNSIKSDSILFMLGEMLLYDFQHLDLSLDRFKLLADKYPNSEFAPKSLYIIANFEPDEDWRDLLIARYPSSSFLFVDTLEVNNSELKLINDKRDYAWSLTKKSYRDAYNAFVKISSEDTDTLSSYICGFLSDYYLNDLELAIFNYQTFINKFPSHFYTETVKKRLDDMRKNIENTKNISEQALAYNLAINYLISDFNYDSVIVLLKEIKKGPSQIYIDASAKAEMAIDKYLELNKIIKDIENDLNIDSLLTESNSALNKFENLDSLYFTMAQLFSEEFQIDDSSILFHKHIVSTFKDSKYRSESILYLQDKDSSEVWSEILTTDNNSILDLDSTIMVPLYLDEVFSLDHVNKEQANIQKYDEYLNIFSDSLNFNVIEPVDSIQISNQSTLIDSSISPVIQSKKLEFLK